MKAHQLLESGISRLKNCCIDEPEANAQWLLAYAMGKKRLELLADLQVEVDSEQQDRFERYMRQKEQGMPLAYIVGTQEFIDITLKTDSRVLVPRPETEELAEYAYRFALKWTEKAGKGAIMRVLDYGSGSGAIGFWLLTRIRNMKLVSADKSSDALDCARENAEILGITDRITFVQTDSPEKIQGNFDLIVSNPPYIPSDVIPGLAPEVLFEPHIALDGGKDGLDVARLLFREAARLLVSGGALFMELSGGDPERLKGECMPRILLRTWKDISFLEDFSGKKRFLYAERV